MKIRRIVVIVLIAFFIIIVVQNLQVVELQVFFWKVSMTRALMLLGTLLIGLISGLLLRRSKAKKS